MMKTYEKKETIQAKLFEKGDEDGMSCIPSVMLCAWKNESGEHRDCANCMLDIKKKPYVKDCDARHEFSEWGNSYLCIGDGSDRFFIGKQAGKPRISIRG